MTKSDYYDNPKKSAFSIEFYDSLWEYEYMKELECNNNISKWTKNHMIQISYYAEGNKFKNYIPDFLVETISGDIEIIEMKATHMLKTINTKRKKEYAEKWCNARNIKYRLISKYQ